MATGTRKRHHGEAMFFQLKEDFQSDHFNLSDIDQRCVAHPDGQPKHSVYLSIYRVLEHVPLEAIESLWLTTAHGRTLEIKKGEESSIPSSSAKFHLYRELCPVHPMIASSMSPPEFCRYITDTSRAVSVPKICFVDLQLSELGDDPSYDGPVDLPYHDVDHVRSCLAELRADPSKQTKTVNRIARQEILYRSISTGFFVGDQDSLLYYHYPSREELNSKHYTWWKCANDGELQHMVSNT